MGNELFACDCLISVVFFSFNRIDYNTNHSQKQRCVFIYSCYA